MKIYIMELIQYNFIFTIITVQFVDIYYVNRIHDIAPVSQIYLNYYYFCK